MLFWGGGGDEVNVCLFVLIKNSKYIVCIWSKFRPFKE